MIEYTPAKVATSIPVIDLSASLAGDAEVKSSTAWEVHKAARETGFFYISGHGVPSEVTEGILEVSRRFFDLPTEDKLDADINHSSCYRGYEPPAFQTLDTGSAADNKEGFQIGKDLGPDHPYVWRGLPNHGPNQWPAAMPELKTVMEDYLLRMHDLAHHLTGLLALSLDLPENYFAPGYAEDAISSRLLYYPSQDGVGEGNQLGAGAHTDWGLITILLQDSIGGLEVADGNGDWIQAPPVDGTFVVNLGDLVPVMTNGLYLSNMHRVLNTAGARRYSVPTFYDLDYDYVAEAVPTTLAEGESAPERITVGDHLTNMFRRTYTA